MVAPAVLSAKAPQPLRPPLKWAGGKRWLVPHLRPLWQGHEWRRFVEPLCGGLAASLTLRPPAALLNDINPHNVNLYRWLQRGFHASLTMANEEALYYEHRRRFNELVLSGRGESQEAAELFYYLNRTGFNGLCRFNRKGEFNVPFGRHRTINYQHDFTGYVDAMADWQFCVGDFETLNLRPDDFIYADPPYDVEFTQYSKEAFGWKQQERLAAWLSHHPGPVILSNQATPRIMDLYRRHGFQLQELDAPRTISCNGDRTRAIEVVATRNL